MAYLRQATSLGLKENGQYFKDSQVCVLAREVGCFEMGVKEAICVNLEKTIQIFIPISKTWIHHHVTQQTENWWIDPANDSQVTTQNLSTLMVHKGYIFRLCPQQV